MNIKANFSHQLQLHLPTSAALENEVCWGPENNTDFDYQARGRLAIERQQCKLSVQLNGTSDRLGLYSSLSHPFKSKIPKTVEVKATADKGSGCGSVHVKADGKNKVKLDAKVNHSFKKGDHKAVELRMNVSQSLLPATTDLHINMAANMSSDSMFLHGSYTQGGELLLLQIKGTSSIGRGEKLSVSGDLRNSMSSLSIFPSSSKLEGALEQSDTLIEGKLKVSVRDNLYSIELGHQEDPALDSDRDVEEDVFGGKSCRAHVWLYVHSQKEHLFVNVSRRLGNPGRGELYSHLSHSFHHLNLTGLPANITGLAKWIQDSHQLSLQAEVQAGPEYLKAKLNGSKTDRVFPQWEYSCLLQHQVEALQRRGLLRSIQAKAHYQLEREGLDTGLVVHVDDKKMANITFNIGSRNITAVMSVSLWQQIKLLQGLMPSSLQMNCTGDTTAERLSAQCFGHVEGQPVESALPEQTLLNVSIIHSGCTTSLRTHLLIDKEQRGSVILDLSCPAGLSLNAAVQHSILALQRLRIPTDASLTLNTSTTHLPSLDLNLDLGRCSFRSKLAETREREGDESYTVNVTNYCPSLQGTVLPVSVALHALLSVSPGELKVSSALSVDQNDLTLHLTLSCRAQHLYGIFTHTFTELRTQGLPQSIMIEATQPKGPEQGGSLLIKAGTCQLRAKRITGDGTKTERLWTLESKCPMFEGHLNGSLWLSPQDTWTVMIDMEQESRRGFLRLNVKPCLSDLHVAAELSHNLHVLKGLPEHSRLRVTGRAVDQQYNTEGAIHLDGCVVSASGAVVSEFGLQGSVVYHNNCTHVQARFSPKRIQASGQLVSSLTHANSQMTVAIDDSEFQTSVALNKTKDNYTASLYLNHTLPTLKNLGIPANTAVAMNSGSHGNGTFFYVWSGNAGNQRIDQEIILSKMSQSFRMQSALRHTVNYLKKLGISGNNSVQVELGNSEEKTVSVQSQFGGEQAGIKLKMKSSAMTREIHGNLRHNSSWLQGRGVPLVVEGLTSHQGTFSHFQSRAQLGVDGHQLLNTGFNVSAGDGRLALQLSYSPLSSNYTRQQFSLGTALVAQLKGPVRSASVDVHCTDWRLRVIGDVGGWRAQGSKEARVTLRHTVQGQSKPALQLEAWGRLTEAQLRCSMALNPELSSSLALIIQGHHRPYSKDLLVKVVQNIPKLIEYVPSQLNFRSQLNQSQSSVSGLLELLSGRRMLWSLGELAVIDSGYRQSLELKHSYSQLKLIPRTVLVKTVYEASNWRYQVQHEAVLGNQEFSLFGLYSAPPALEMGNQTLKVQIKCVPRWTHLEATMERSLQGGLDGLSLGWMRLGKKEQVRALSSWSRSEGINETKLELEQPFTVALRQLSLRTLSHSLQSKQNSQHQTRVSLDAGSVLVNVSLDTQRQTNSNTVQACVLFSSQQTAASSGKGCVSVGQEGSSYSQHAELRWDDRSITQGLKYQRNPPETHDLQVNIVLDKVSSAPCSSHSLLAKVQTNLRNGVEHSVLLGLCPPQPSFLWSGSHRVNSGEELFYTQSYLSVVGRPHQCSLTLALLNSSSSSYSLFFQGTNISLYSESRIGNWSVDVGGSALFWPQGAGLQVQANLDRSEKIWLNGTLEGGCLKTAAGYIHPPGHCEDLSVMACMGTNHTLVLDVQTSENCSKSKSLGQVSAVTSDKKLILTVSGCLESLTAAEARIHSLSNRIWRKMSERVGTLQHLLTELRRRSRDSEVLQELSAASLQVVQRAETFLAAGDSGLLVLWQNSQLRQLLTNSLPQLLLLLQHASLVGQQELRRPLATLAGVYQDVNGQQLETLWRQAVLLWTDRVVEVLRDLLGNTQLVQTGIPAFSAALDLAGQQTYQWMETRLATALSGVRKQLASFYKFNPSDCSVTVSVPLPLLLQSKWAQAGLVEVLLEEWVLTPLQTLASIKPAAELYRFKRKIIDSPFQYQALLVSDQFVVTFDGHLYELPSSCPLVLAQDASAEPSFTVLLSSGSPELLLVEMNNSTFNILQNGQVRDQCNRSVAHTFYSESGVSVKIAPHTVQVSNPNGVSVSCDHLQQLCSFTLDGWLHGTSTGVFGSNDNEAGNDFPLPNGSQAENVENFFNSWQIKRKCFKTPAATVTSPVSCESLFSSPESPLSSCFRVVDPAQFLTVCESSSSQAPCLLASAFVHLCMQNYIPLDAPPQCCKSDTNPTKMCI